MNVFATLILAALVFISLGRIPELFTVLAPLQLGKVSVAAGLLAVLALNPKRLTILFREKPLGLCLLIILALSFVGIPFSVLKSGALESFIGFSRILLIATIIAALSTGGREQALRTTIVWTLLIMAVVMLLDKGTGRIGISNTYDPNDLALLFVVYLPIVANEALTGSKWTRPVALAASVLAIMAVALTGSRGGIVALVAVGLHALLHVKSRRWVLVPALALAVIIVSVTADGSLWERFESLQDNTDYNLEGKTGRLTIWKEGLWLMLTHPLLGVGLWQFPVALGMLGNGAWKAAHNIFLQIGTELGLFGLAAFCVILFSIFRLTGQGVNSPFLPQRERQRFAALRFSLTGYCVGGFFLSQAYGFIFFVFLALATVMHIQLREAERAAEPLPEPDTVPLPQARDNERQDAPPELSVASLSDRARDRRARREARLGQGDAHYTRNGGGGS